MRAGRSDNDTNGLGCICMRGLRRRLNDALSRPFPEKRIFIQSGGATRYMRFSPSLQLLCCAAAIVAAGWTTFATATTVLGHFASGRESAASILVPDAWEARLNELAAERDLRAAEAVSAQSRFQAAMEQIGRQQTAILRSVEERRELSAALDLMRARVQEAVAQRDSIAATNEILMGRMSEVSDSLASGSSEDLTLTLQAVSSALADAVVARDTATAERVELTERLASLENRMRLNARRQDEMIEQLEQAIAMSFGPLEKLFEKTDLDIDRLVATVRRNHSGQGGQVTVSTRSFDDASLGGRFDELMIDFDRMNLMRIAATKLPYAMPVAATHRFTSGFGYRRDPKGAGRRMHSGVDFAAPRGTPILATGDGVVKSAGWENGYGNTVRIQHEFGFETVYAHQHTLRVKKGQQVSRGEHIGDMGTTGRSTGVHLHYEVRLNGTPVNPMTYLEAAKDVF